jgi:DNA-binding Lrp family transcriptional regulator
MSLTEARLYHTSSKLPPAFCKVLDVLSVDVPVDYDEIIARTGLARKTAKSAIRALDEEGSIRRIGTYKFPKFVRVVEQ